MSNIKIPHPDLQIGFAEALQEIRSRYLFDALSSAIQEIEISKIDQELSKYVPKDSLKKLARKGIRGELAFPVPEILKVNPYLLGYYRLLLGFSQKEFYTTALGLSKFKRMEDKGQLSPQQLELLPLLCAAISNSIAALIDSIPLASLQVQLLHELELLTLGPQLRGGANVKKGIARTKELFEIIRILVSDSIISYSPEKLILLNAAKREVEIAFASDPDITIKVKMESGAIRNIIAIEIKGGTDFSNIHNRIGEAEKSHQKARSAGFVECWTVINVNNFDHKMAKEESPSTNRFFRLDDLKNPTSQARVDFVDRITSLVGI